MRTDRILLFPCHTLDRRLRKEKKDAMLTLGGRRFIYTRFSGIILQEPDYRLSQLHHMWN